MILDVVEMAKLVVGQSVLELQQSINQKQIVKSDLGKRVRRLIRREKPRSEVGMPKLLF